MTLTVTQARLHLYTIVCLFSFVLMGLSAGRLQYTTHLPRGDPLNQGRDFFDTSVLILLITSTLLIVFSLFFRWMISRRVESGFMSRLWFELVVLWTLWAALLVGSAMATSVWPDLSFCSQFNACRVLQTLVAFCWLTWLPLLPLIAISMHYGIVNRAWGWFMHGWSPWHDNSAMRGSMMPRISVMTQNTTA
ncbi:hypothetical protein SISNIDRAFT_426522 [Sistotremastrum niveocremeum HHB9708]|uniref:MARVEL domain-containing protein n=1 Tax=Sistotremastrum niveocremeum HHB9708 TaxID=1314777 RepID=A0A164WDH4_9AGAM|nr:hypothetical protein SISNIDRAFT_426522 [Sistotremastrum niveocremeum HHB9708]